MQLQTAPAHEPAYLASRPRFVLMIAVYAPLVELASFRLLTEGHLCWLLGEIQFLKHGERALNSTNHLDGTSLHAQAAEADIRTGSVSSGMVNFEAKQ